MRRAGRGRSFGEEGMGEFNGRRIQTRGERVMKMEKYRKMQAVPRIWSW
jgi:hypothetical protein